MEHSGFSGLCCDSLTAVFKARWDPITAELKFPCPTHRKGGVHLQLGGWRQWQQNWATAVAMAAWVCLWTACGWEDTGLAFWTYFSVVCHCFVMSDHWPMNHSLLPECFGLPPALVFIGNFSDTCGETKKQICLRKSPKRLGSAMKIFFASVGQSQS